MYISRLIQLVGALTFVHGDSAPGERLEHRAVDCTDSLPPPYSAPVSGTPTAYSPPSFSSASGLPGSLSSVFSAIPTPVPSGVPSSAEPASIFPTPSLSTSSAINGSVSSIIDPGSSTAATNGTSSSISLSSVSTEALPSSMANVSISSTAPSFTNSSLTSVPSSASSSTFASGALTSSPFQSSVPLNISTTALGTGSFTGPNSLPLPASSGPFANTTGLGTASVSATGSSGTVPLSTGTSPFPDPSGSGIIWSTYQPTNAPFPNATSATTAPLGTGTATLTSLLSSIAPGLSSGAPGTGSGSSSLGGSSTAVPPFPANSTSVIPSSGFGAGTQAGSISPTPTSSGVFSTTSPPASFTTRRSCVADTCLGPLEATQSGRQSDAASFCSRYTRGTIYPQPSFVPWPCNANQVFSACSCFDRFLATATATTNATATDNFGPPTTTTDPRSAGAQSSGAPGASSGAANETAVTDRFTLSYSPSPFPEGSQEPVLTSALPGGSTGVVALTGRMPPARTSLGDADGGGDGLPYSSPTLLVRTRTRSASGSDETGALDAFLEEYARLEELFMNIIGDDSELSDELLQDMEDLIEHIDELKSQGEDTKHRQSNGRERDDGGLDE